MTYGNEHIPHTTAAKNAAYNVASLSMWWGDKRLSDVTSRNCRAYAETKTPSAGRRDLETLRAAINYWHEEYGPLPSIPAVVMPPKPEARDRWLTRSEAAQLLWAARRTPHLARFILLGLHTGSRSGVITALRWEWIDLKTGVMRRRAAGKAEDKRKRTPPVRLGRKLLTHLRRWHRMDEGAGPWVVHYDGKPVKRIKRAWAGAVKRAGLVGVTPHTLRHTRATWLMLAGIDAWEAAGSLGMSVEMLQRTYGHHHPDFQKQAAEV